jgi:hypothetical protein
MKEALRADIEAAAKAKGISLNAEAVERLEKFGQREGVEYEKFGDKATYRLMVLLATTLQLIETVTGKKWHKDELTYEEARQAIDAFFERFRPLPTTQRLPSHQDLDYGRRIAPMVLDTMMERAGAIKKARRSEE